MPHPYLWGGLEQIPSSLNLWVCEHTTCQRLCLQVEKNPDETMPKNSLAWGGIQTRHRYYGVYDMTCLYNNFGDPSI